MLKEKLKFLEYSAGRLADWIVPAEELSSKLDMDLPLYFDTETIGLYGTIRLAQCYQSDWEHPLFLEYPDPAVLVGVLHEQHIVCHNLTYDISTIQLLLGRYSWVPTEFDCTLLLARLALPELKKFDLASVASAVLEQDPYHLLDKKAMQKSDWAAEELDVQQLYYAAIDVLIMPDIYEAIADQKTALSYILDKHTLRKCFIAQNNGVPLDTDKARIKLAENTKRVADIALPINANSYQQVRKFLGVDPRQKTDDLELAKLVCSGKKEAGDIREVRSLLKQNSFINKFLATEENGHIYGTLAPMAKSGRMISKNQNLLQIPRALKGLFGYNPDQGRVFIYSDFSQLELRCACAYIGEHTMEKLFKQGVDLHSYTAKATFPETCISPENFAKYGNSKEGREAQTEDDRGVAKTENFHFIYGGGMETFGNLVLQRTGLGLSDSETRRLRDEWRLAWPGIYEWQQKSIEEWREKMIRYTPLGRPYYGERLTDFLNIAIQGFGAEVAKLAWHYMDTALIEEKLDADLHLLVHDSFMFSCIDDKDLYTRCSEIVAESMQEAWSEVSRNALIKDLPMPVEVFVGYNWGEIETDFIHKLERD